MSCPCSGHGHTCFNYEWKYYMYVDFFIHSKGNYISSVVENEIHKFAEPRSQGYTTTCFQRTVSI